MKKIGSIIGVFIIKVFVIIFFAILILWLFLVFCDAFVLKEIGVEKNLIDNINKIIFLMILFSVVIVLLAIFMMYLRKEKKMLKKYRIDDILIFALLLFLLSVSLLSQVLANMVSNGIFSFLNIRILNKDIIKNTPIFNLNNINIVAVTIVAILGYIDKIYKFFIKDEDENIDNKKEEKKEMKERRYKRVKRVIGYSVAMLCLMIGCAGMTGCKGSEVVNVIGEQEKRIEEQYAPANQGEKQKEEEQVIGGSAGVKEGKALIEGVKICENGVITNEKYRGLVEKHTKTKGYDNSLHTWTEFYSKTLNKIVLIDNNKKSGTRTFFDANGDGKSFFRVTGESLLNQTAEESMQKYVAMKGLAKAIDGSK